MEAVIACRSDLCRVGKMHAPVSSHATGHAPTVQGARRQLFMPRGCVIDPDRADQNRGGQLALSVSHVGCDVIDVLVRCFGNLVGGAIEARLEVIGAQNDHHDVQGIGGAEETGGSTADR